MPTMAHDFDDFTRIFFVKAPKFLLSGFIIIALPTPFKHFLKISKPGFEIAFMVNFSCIFLIIFSKIFSHEFFMKFFHKNLLDVFNHFPKPLNPGRSDQKINRKNIKEKVQSNGRPTKA